MSLRAALVCLLAPFGLCPAAVITGTWSLASPGGGELRLTLVRDGTVVDGKKVLRVNPAEIPGSLPSGGGRWEIRRDAGVLRLKSVTGTEGSFEFHEDPVYVAEAMRVAGGWHDPAGAFELMVREVPLARLQWLREQGVTGLRIAQVAAPDWAGIPARQRAAETAASRPRPRLPELRRPPGARPPEGDAAAFLRAARESGYPFFAEDVPRLRLYGVAPDLLRQLKLSAYDALTLSDMVRLQSHGVTGFDVRRLEIQGRRNLSVDEIVRLRDTPAAAPR